MKLLEFMRGRQDAQRLGFDARNHGAHGYLIDQFFGKARTSAPTVMEVQWRREVALQQK